MPELITQVLGKEESEAYIKNHPFLKTKECQKWLQGLYTRTKGKNGFTKKNLWTHVSRLSLYIDFTGMNPTELIDEVEADTKLDRREQSNPASLKIKTFFNELKEKGKAPKTSQAYAMTVRGFYKHNGFPIQVYIPSQQGIKAKIELDKELIRKTLNNTQKLRDRAIILIMVSSGMSIEDVLDLKYHHVKDQLEAGEKPLKLEFARVKNSQPYVTFFSTECVNVLQQYIETDRKGIAPKDPVFINMRGLPLNYQATRRVLTDISRRTVGDTKINTKSFRRFFSTEMRKAGMPADWVEYMMGHSIGVSGSYLNNGVLREMYEEKENAVTIMTTVVKEQAKELREEFQKQQQAEKEGLKWQIEQQNQTILALQKQMSTIMEKLGA